MTDGITLQHSDATHLSTALLALRELGSLCDLVIRCDEEDGDNCEGSIFAHACVLAACSPLLKEQITAQKQAGDEFTEISGEGISQQVWEYIIHFMYTASVFIPVHHEYLLKDIAAAAKHLQFNELSELAREYHEVLQLMDKEDSNRAIKEAVVKTEPQEDTDDSGENLQEEQELEEEEEEEMDEDEVVAEVESCVKMEDDAPRQRLKCLICSYTAKTQKALDAHSKRHAREKENKPKQCKLCIETFSSLSALNTHMKGHQQGENYPCPSCDFEGLTLKELMIHSEIHKELHRCPIEDCDFETKKHGMITKHLKMKHEEVRRPYKCSECDYAAEKKVMLKLHSERHSDKRTHECDVCEKSFKRHRDLWRHRQQLHGGDKYKCNVCDRLFNRKVYMQDHIRRDHKIGQLKCTVQGCDLEFQTYDRLYRHKRLIHDNRSFERHRKHMCDLCGRCFFTKSHLITHERSHNNERPFACELCPKAFLQRSDLTKHMMIHTGVKPFLCSVCPYTTNRASNLKSHEKRHKGQKLRSTTGKSDNELKLHKKGAVHASSLTLAAGKKSKKVAEKAEAFTEIIVKYEETEGMQEEDEDDEEVETVVVSNPQPFAASPTKMNVLEKCNTLTDRPAKKALPAVECRVPKSAIIAEFASGQSSVEGQSAYHLYTPIDQSVSQPQKYTQIVTTTLPTSGKIQTVLQSNSNLPSSLCIISPSEQDTVTEALPVQLIQDVNLGSEDAQVVQVNTSSSHLGESYSPAVYTIMNPGVGTISPQPTAIEDGDDYTSMSTKMTDSQQKSFVKFK